VNRLSAPTSAVEALVFRILGDNGQGQSEAFSSYLGVVRLAETSGVHTVGEQLSGCPLPLAIVLSLSQNPPPAHATNNLGGVG